MSLFWIGWIALDKMVCWQMFDNRLPGERELPWSVAMTDFHSVSPPNRANFNLPTSLQNSWTSPPMGLYEPALTQRCSGMLVYLNLTCLSFFIYQKACLAKCSLKYISSSWFHNMIILYLSVRWILHELMIILQLSLKGTSQWSIFVMTLLAMICLGGLLALKANQSSVSLD